jgi:hypothetical protein
LKDQYDDKWEMLKQLKPPAHKKEAIRRRIIGTIRTQTAKRPRRFEWKNVVLTSLFLLISAGLLFQLQSDYQKEDVKVPANRGNGSFNWGLENVYAEKTKEGFAFFQEGSSVQVGYAEEVSEEEQRKFTNTTPISVKKTLENFPYPTTLNIEHVKMMDVALRYHFFINDSNKIIHFSFDYPKLEYAEIFHFIATLKFTDREPYIHDEPLYVTHGYDTLPFPVGLEPVEKFGQKETYIWENTNAVNYSNYLQIIKSTGEWEERQASGASHIFDSTDGYVVVKITLEEKQITYEFSYPKQGE